MSETIGVLAMQGAFLEHEKMLHRLGCQVRQVRTEEQLQAVDGLIIPGGESTTIGKLLQTFGLDKAIRTRAQKGMPIWGTCAGMILMAKRIDGYPDQFCLGLIDCTAVRNAFGRQVDSFEAALPIAVLGERPFPAIFIRAPYINDVAPNVGILAQYDGKIVLIRQGQYLASAFHPELTGDTRIHEYFVDMVKETKE